MNRVVHFEIHAQDLDRAQKVYADVFGWKITALGPQMGNYRMVATGDDEPGARYPGINGGITPRVGPPSTGSDPVNAFVCTIGVDNLDAYVEKVLNAGGSIAMEKMQVPGIGWLAYVKDPERNLFGMLQPDIP